MADIEIAVDGGTSKRLLTAGKYCDRNILVTATGGGGSPASVSPKDINFYDYDGTLVEAWTLEELAGKSALPANPTHDGLTAQGWNWSLADLKSTNRAMNVGQMYVTDDGKTRLYITIAAPGRQDVPLYIRQTAGNGVTIDWGDGSPAETLPGAGNVNTTHHYAEIGDYVITLDPAQGCTLGLGRGLSMYCVLGSTGNEGRVYCNMLRKVEIGQRVTSIGSYAFQSCYSLASIIIPDGVTSIESSVFQGCYSLASITIPDGVTSIESYVFRSCYSLASIIIPDGVTSIGSYAFQNCYGMAEYHFQSAEPPALSNSNAFSGIPDDCVIYVPKGSLAAYQSATNWSQYADQMQEEPT